MPILIMAQKLMINPFLLGLILRPLGSNKTVINTIILHFPIRENCSYGN